MSAFDPYRELLKMPDGPRPPSARELLGLETGEFSRQAVQHALARRMEHVRRYANSPSAEVAESVAQLLNEIAAAAVSLLAGPAADDSMAARGEQEPIARSEEALDEAQIEEALADFLLSANPEEAEAAHTILDGLAARRRRREDVPQSQRAAEAAPAAVPNGSSSAESPWLRAWRPVGLATACLMAAGLWSSTGWLLAPPAAPPPMSVHLEFSPPTCLEGQAIRATVSIHGGTPTSRRPAKIDWGDGTWSRVDPAATEHVYGDNGTYTVTVFDSRGAPYPQEATVEVQNADPILHGLADYTVDQGEKIEVEMEFSDPGARDTHTAKVDWGDQIVLNGKITVPSPSSERSLDPVRGKLAGAFIYREPGRYPVRVTLTDKDGGQCSGQLFVNVRKRDFRLSVVLRQQGATEPPTQSLSIFEGDEVSLQGAFNSMGVGRRYAAKINWGDGTRVDGDVAEPSNPSENGSVSASHCYGDDGDYRVTVTVTDDIGHSATTTQAVTVENAAPVLQPAENREVYAGEAISLQLHFSDPGIRDTHTAEVDWGDGTRSQAQITAAASSSSRGMIFARHVYRRGDRYQATARVVDHRGGRGQSTFSVNVVEAASPHATPRMPADGRWHVIVMTWPDRTSFGTVIHGDRSEAQAFVEKKRKSEGPCRSQRRLTRDSEAGARGELMRQMEALERQGFQEKPQGFEDDWFNLFE